MDETEHNMLVYKSYPGEHRTRQHSTNPLERLNAEINHRTRMVWILPNEAAISRLAGAILAERKDEWAVRRAK